MAQNDSLAKEFEHELKDLLDCEKQLTQALPKMARAASTEELRTAFEEHLAETEQHIERLQGVFEDLDISPRAVKCEGIRGIIHEGESLISKASKGAALDAVLIGTAQKAEHYEIASYGTLLTWAKRLGKDDVVRSLKETLREEKKANELLTDIAERVVNPAAVSA